MDHVNWISRWFAEHCDGEYEHDHGVTIRTLDNPGWQVRIYLGGTELEAIPFDEIEKEESEHEWVHCRIEKDFFIGFGGPLNLSQILEIFQNWAERHGKAVGS